MAQKKRTTTGDSQRNLTEVKVQLFLLRNKNRMNGKVLATKWAKARIQVFLWQTGGSYSGGSRGWGADSVK